MSLGDRDLDQRAAGLLFVGFEGKELTDGLRVLIDRGVSGAVLFSRNVESAAQVAELTYEIKAYAGRPFCIATDQEGGVVQRLRAGFTRVPPMRVVGATASVEMAWELGCIMGRELRAVNIDMNFAPVLDVDTNPQNPVIGSRSLSSDPQVVSAMGVALGRGLESEGVAACGKHFPGHGDTELDSHLSLPVLPHAIERLRQVELAPFVAWADSLLASVMSAHVVFSALDPDWPATMSKSVLDGLLRDKIGFEGLLVSDDLEMKAIVDHFGVGRAAALGLAAGVDVFLVCRRAEAAHQAIDAMVEACRSGQVSAERLVEAEARVERFLRRWALPPQAFDASALSDSGGGSWLARLAQTPGAQKVAEGRSVDPTERSLQ